ncbi:hypothetical protein TVD_01420 [Thioalkalivibrio versutus]|uniref:PilY1 beta-propeller domain-containing protein n=2 Tax=Thioalkalivibrio versutus TaxID=106634 RepID=A0A0G3GC06_9GAMM|nr:hypothetical protein TVD_01420 [Thioalkalivibrio versutus]
MMVGMGSAHSSQVAQTPLFLTSSVDPNVMFILDDSGSMHWDILPDDSIYSYYTFPRPSGVYGSSNYSHFVVNFNDNIYSAFLRSAETNAQYYNPRVTYKPWVESDGTPMDDAPIDAAPHNPMLPGLGSRDLTADNTNTAGWDNCLVSSQGNFSGCTYNAESRTFFPSIYYRFDGGDISDLGNYERVEIRPSTSTYTFSQAGDPPDMDYSELRSDCSAGNGTCTYSEEIQNFANWYTYHRSRILTSRGAIGTAFAEQGDSFRVGYGAINAGTSNVDDVDTDRIIRGVRAFSGSDRDAWFDLLYERPIPAAGTPLRTALQSAGEYFSRSDSQGPWSSTPGQTGGEDLECRQSFTILMSDGYWNGASPAVGNTDGSAGPEIESPDGDTVQYQPSAPFEDDYSNTLADVAMHYWKRDLQPGLANRVPDTEFNPAFWQHMVTYTVGLGVYGDIDPDAAFAAIETGDNIDWPNPTSSNEAKIDDMLHAAVNSRGGFFSTDDPDVFASELSEVLQDIIGRVETSATSAAVSSAVLETQTRAFLAGFRSTDWSGTLEGRPIGAGGTVAESGCAECWDAEEELAAQAASGNRNIFTRATNAAGVSGTGGGVQFQASNLHADQLAALDHNSTGANDGRGPDRVAWLGGEELSGFRSRTESGEPRLLGDIINSDPVFEDGVIYVGANDGMLHAFDGETGKELFAFIPSRLLLPEDGADFAPLSRLTDENYADNHRYFVDGKLAVRRVVDGDGDLRTVLVGSLGAGGRQVFALDVSDPGNFSSDDVLWEFSHAELGVSIGAPQVARTRPNGEWAAFFGNGYNSASHEASLFVVDLFTGDLETNISTGVGDDTTPNGLATPFVTDWPSGDFRADRVYAGDRLGNLWVFDLSSDTHRLLANATDPSGNPQPITTRPVGQILDSGEAMISFGTGSFLFNADGTDNQVQSLYGVLDTQSPAGQAAERSDLVTQEIVFQGTVDTASGPQEVRVISDNPVDLTTDRGWILDLDLEDGERVISPPRALGVNQQRVRFSTLVPDDDPCGTGRRGFLMDFDLLTGGRLSQPVFDLDGDGQFGDSDLVTIPGLGDVPISGLAFGQGESTTSVLGGNGNGNGNGNGDPDECDGVWLFTGQGEKVCVDDEDRLTGRQSWQQLR